MTRINQTTKKNSRSLRREMTDAEQLLWRHLRMRQMGGYKFRRQHPLGRYILDFVCLEAALVVEVDGGQHAENAEQDLLRTMFLSQQGLHVLRFWNNDVLKDIESVKQVIWNALGKVGTEPPSQPSPLKGEGEGCADLGLGCDD
jgi:adenine-specific DNA-methyltransferase